MLEVRPAVPLPSHDELQELKNALEAESHVTINPILVFKKRTLPKTTSGKVRRKECKKRYFNSSLGTTVAHIGHLPSFSSQALLGNKHGRASKLGGGSRNDEHQGTVAEATSFTDLLHTYGVEDMSKCLVDNGVDSLRLIHLIDEARELFGVVIGPASATTVPAGQLAMCRSGMSFTGVPASAIPTSAAWQGLSRTQHRQAMLQRSANSGAHLDSAPSGCGTQPEMSVRDIRVVVASPQASALDHTVAHGSFTLISAADSTTSRVASPLSPRSLRGVQAAVCPRGPSRRSLPSERPNPTAAVNSVAAARSPRQRNSRPTMSCSKSAMPPTLRSTEISVGTAAVQTVLFMVIVLLVTGCVGPAAILHVKLFNWLEARPDYRQPWLTTFSGGPGLTLVLTALTWMATYTVLIVMIKWLVVGRYKPGTHEPWSSGYMRWWFVDRLVSVWERTVGVHLLGTPYLNLVYKCLGAPHLPLSVRLDSFIREFDLFSAGRGVHVEGVIMCRLVSPAGLLLGPVALRACTSVAEQRVVYPGEVVDGGRHGARTQQGVQRAVAPAVVLACASAGLYASSWLSVHVVGLNDDDSAGRTLACFILTPALLMVGVMVLCRLCRLSFLMDRLYSTGADFLALYLDYSSLNTLLAMGLGADVTLATHVNKCSGTILPSTAHLVSAGRNTIVTSSRLRPRPGFPITIGDNCLVGTHAFVASGVTIESCGEVGAGATAEASTLVKGDTVLIGCTPPKVADGSPSQATQQPITMPSRGWRPIQSPWFVSTATILKFLVWRALLQWLPLAACYVVVLHTARLVVSRTGRLPVWLQAPLVCAVVICMAAMLLALLLRALQCTAPRASAAQLQKPERPFASWALSSWRTAGHGALTAVQYTLLAWCMSFVRGTWMMNALLRGLGARISVRDATILGVVADMPLLTVGRGVVIDRHTFVDAHRFDYGQLKFFGTRFEDGCAVQPGSLALGGTWLGAGVVLSGRTRAWGTGRIAITTCGQHGVLSGVPAFPAEPWLSAGPGGSRTSVATASPSTLTSHGSAKSVASTPLTS